MGRMQITIIVIRIAVLSCESMPAEERNMTKNKIAAETAVQNRNIFTKAISSEFHNSCRTFRMSYIFFTSVNLQLINSCP